MEIKLTSGTKAELIKAENTERGLVIIPDVMGLRPLFTEMASRLSKEWNASVCTFDVFPEHTFPEEPDADKNLQNHYAAVKELTDSRIFEDATEAAQMTESPMVGLTGFCMGGMYTLKTMGTGVFNRGVAFYPQIKVPDNWKGPGHGEPLDLISSESAERILAVIGTEDHYTPPEDVEELEASGVKTIQYEGCEHGFVHDPHRPAHRPDEAADSLSKAAEFLFGS